MRFAGKLSIAVATLSLAALANAGQSADYGALDADKDGTVTREEAKALPELDKRWSEVDVDRDDQLSEGEFARFEEQQSSDSESDAGAQPETDPGSAMPGPGGIQ